MTRRTSSGRIVSIVTGGASRPTIIFDCDAVWRLPRRDGAWAMLPAAILPTAVRVTMDPPVSIIDAVAERVRVPQRPDDHSVCVIETTNAPALPSAFLSRYPNAFSGGVQAARLVTGSGPLRQELATQIIPAFTMISEFHNGVETRGEAFLCDRVGDVPVPATEDLCAVSFSRYETGDDIMPIDKLRSALAAAESLWKSKPSGEDAFDVLSNPREAVAAGLFLAHWIACQRPPSSRSGSLSRYGGYSSFGGGPLRRGVGGV